MPAILSLLLLAQVPAEKPLKRSSVPLDAVAIALADVAGGHAAYYRYVWVPSGTEEDCDCVDVAVNTAISKSPNLVNGVRLAGGLVLRYDLQALAPKGDDLKHLVELWEGFAGDEPYFLVPALAIKKACEIHTFDAVLGTVQAGDKLAYLGSHTDEDNEWWVVNFNGQKGYILKANAEKVRVFGKHCSDEAFNLNLACESKVPLVRAEWFVRIILSTLEGGKYYEFRGIEESPDENVSDIDYLLKKEGKVKLQDFKDAGSDQKTLTDISGVTKDPRLIIWITGSQNLITKNQGLIVITQDVNDGVIADPNADPTQSIDTPKYNGIELFLEMQNGLILYALYTGDLNGDGKFDPKAGEGKLVRVAPPELVGDSTVPDGHGAQLQPGKSCMFCHIRQKGGVEPDGWLPVERNFPNPGGVDVFGEKKPSRADVDRLAGQFTGNFDKVFGRARDDYAEAMLRLTNEPGTKKASVVTVQIRRLEKMYNGYWYDPVTAKTAAKEAAGIALEDDQAAIAMLKRLLPPLPPNKFGFSPEDGRLGMLKDGRKLRRVQWEQVFGDAAYRSLEALKN